MLHCFEQINPVYAIYGFQDQYIHVKHQHSV